MIERTRLWYLNNPLFTTWASRCHIF